MDLVEFYIRHFILNILNMFAKLKAVKGTLTGLEKGLDQFIVYKFNF